MRRGLLNKVSGGRSVDDGESSRVNEWSDSTTVLILTDLKSPFSSAQLATMGHIDHRTTQMLPNFKWALQL